MECKAGCRGPRRSRVGDPNLTIMECKEKEVKEIKRRFCHLNLTIMECKGVCAIGKPRPI